MFGLPKCFFFHNWTKWARKIKKFNRSIGGVWMKGPDGKVLVYQEFFLERTCLDCGAVDQRKLPVEGLDA